jgi:hypothetical protein
MINKIKVLLRELIPPKYQVFTKYSFNRFSSVIELEMGLLKHFVEVEQLQGGTLTLEMFRKILDFWYEGCFVRNRMLNSIKECVLGRDQSPDNLRVVAKKCS